MISDLIDLKGNISVKVDSLRIFGSAMRNDWAAGSDIDILCVSDLKSDDLRVVKQMLQKEIGELASISFYTPERIKMMFENGHLFAWHLYLESKSILQYDSDYIDSLGKPADYKDVIEDIGSLLTILHEVQSTNIRSSSFIFQCGLVYLCLRNIALCASWRSENGLNFSKNSPFSLSFGASVEAPMDYNIYSTLIAARHASTRGEKVASIDRGFLEMVTEKAIRWSENILAIMRECNA